MKHTCRVSQGPIKECSCWNWMKPLLPEIQDLSLIESVLELRWSGVVIMVIPTQNIDHRCVVIDIALSGLLTIRAAGHRFSSSHNRNMQLNWASSVINATTTGSAIHVELAGYVRPPTRGICTCHVSFSFLHIRRFVLPRRRCIWGRIRRRFLDGTLGCLR